MSIVGLVGSFAIFFVGHPIAWETLELRILNLKDVKSYGRVDYQYVLVYPRFFQRPAALISILTPSFDVHILTPYPTLRADYPLGPFLTRI